MKNTSFWPLPLVLLAATAFPAGAADLMSVYRDAVVHDAQFASARAALEAGREKLPQGRAGLMPVIGLGGNTTFNDTEVKTRAHPSVERDARYNSNGWTATLTQPLFRWQNWVGYKQGELAVGVAEAQFAAARQDLIVRVAQAYFDVLLAQETVATVAAQKTAVAEQLESAKRNFEVGTATITDTHEAQAKYDLVIATELAAQNDLTVKRETLRVLVGKEQDALKRLRPGVEISRPQPDDVGQWATTAEAGSLAVAQAQGALDIAREEIGRQRGGHYPTLDLVASHGRSGTGFSSTTASGSDSKATTIGLQLSVPIFAGGGVSSREREAVALRDKAAADLDNLGYEVGVRINIDVLNAQSQLYDTRQKLVKARLDTLIAQLRLKSAAGNLTEDDLAAINALLE